MSFSRVAQVTLSPYGVTELSVEINGGEDVGAYYISAHPESPGALRNIYFQRKERTSDGRFVYRAMFQNQSSDRAVTLSLEGGKLTNPSREGFMTLARYGASMKWGVEYSTDQGPRYLAGHPESPGLIQTHEQAKIRNNNGTFRYEATIINTDPRNIAISCSVDHGGLANAYLGEGITTLAPGASIRWGLGSSTDLGPQFLSAHPETPGRLLALDQEKSRGDDGTFWYSANIVNADDQGRAVSYRLQLGQFI